MNSYKKPKSEKKPELQIPLQLTLTDVCPSKEIVPNYLHSSWALSLTFYHILTFQEINIDSF